MASKENTGFRGRIWDSLASRKSYLLVLVAAIVLIGVASAFLVWGDIASLKSLGYPGLAIINFLSSASLIVPIPGFAGTIAGGAFLNPFIVAVVAASGEALGELTGYMVGFGGQSILEQKPFYQQVSLWMRKRGAIIVFLVSAIPNPFFDVVGVTAGAVRFPLWLFLIVCWAGKVLKDLGFALIGYYGIPWLLPLLNRLF